MSVPSRVAIANNLSAAKAESDARCLRLARDGSVRLRSCSRNVSFQSPLLRVPSSTLASARAGKSSSMMAFTSSQEGATALSPDLSARSCCSIFLRIFPRALALSEWRERWIFFSLPLPTLVFISTRRVAENSSALHLRMGNSPFSPQVIFFPVRSGSIRGA